MKTTHPLQANSRLMKLPTYVFAWLDDLKAAARAAGADLIDLGMGNPDQPTPRPVVETLQRAWANPENHGYPPFKGKPEFLKAVADWTEKRFGVAIDPATQALCLSGSKGGIADISMAYIAEGDVSLVPEIYYPVLSRATWLSGGDVHHMPMRAENGFLAEFDNIPAAVLDRARLMFLNYPNNPTGGIAPLDYYKKAVEFCKTHGIVLVSDLAYSEITFGGYVAPSIFEVEGAMDVAIEMHSFSKSFNMAGSRLGWAIGNPEIIHNLYSYRTNVGYGTPGAIQDGGVAALTHALDYLPIVAETYGQRRDVVVAGFQKLGWQVETPQASLYVWLRVPAGFTSQAWTQYLIDEAGVVVTPGNAFGKGGEGFFRVSLVSPSDTLQRAIERLEAKGIRYHA